MKYLISLASVIVLLAAASAQSRPFRAGFSFPGSTNHVHSNKGDLSASYTVVRATDDENQYTFAINDLAGRALIEHKFTRNIEGMWSPFTQSLYVNDFMGSTQIDCFVWSDGDNRLFSLTDTLLHDPHSGPVEGHGAKPPETPQNSRFELTCGRWVAKNKVSVRLEGTTWAGGDFKYQMFYDLQLGIV